MADQLSKMAATIIGSIVSQNTVSGLTVSPIRCFWCVNSDYTSSCVIVRFVEFLQCRTFFLNFGFDTNRLGKKRNSTTAFRLIP